MRNRLDRGKLNKALRGELFLQVPMGYIKLPSGQLAYDADEQVRSVVALIFEKFEELGAPSRVYRYLINHGIRVGIRLPSGPHQGQLEWRRPCRATVYAVLRNPMYAGAYAYGRCPVDRPERLDGVKVVSPKGRIAPRRELVH